MEKLTYPLIDYRTFLSDIGTGIIALISIIIIVIKQHPDNECKIHIILELQNIFFYFAQKINEMHSNEILIIIISILFITPLIGFTINASSYLFLNWFLRRLSDNKRFNGILKSIGIKNYLDIEFKSEDSRKLEQNDYTYSEIFNNIKINLIAKTGKNIISQYDRILGGHNMCRNCTFIIIIDLYIILLIYDFIWFLIVFLYSTVIYLGIRLKYCSIKKHIPYVFLLYLFSLPILTFIGISIKYNFKIYYVVELIMFTEFFLLFTIFLSAFFIVHNNHDIYKCSIIYLEIKQK